MSFDVIIGDAMRWARANLFASWTDALLTLVALWILWLLVPPLLDWAIFSATWSGDSREACVGEGKGACWPFIQAKWQQFIYGRYPVESLWRVNLVFLVGAAAMLTMLIPRVPYKRANALFLILAYPVFCFVMLAGGYFGLQEVETSLWGGLVITLVVAVVGNAASMPLGVLLALGRRSELPVVRMLCTGFIEFWRGIPLITVLFMASVMLPLVLNEGVTVDKLLRCLIGVALFSSAYMAEVVRGGLQVIPRGQYEAADALGLSYWQSMRLIILPQALKYVIPGIVNSFIALFKDTTLVLIVGLFDLLGIVQLHFSDPNWVTPQTRYTGYAFAGFLFWIFCYAMSRYSQYMERRLATDRRLAH